MSILAADRCQSRAPALYIADDYTEVGDIVNAKLGDVAIVVADGVFQSWRLTVSDVEPDGFETIESNTCEYTWRMGASSLSFSVTAFGAVGDGVTDDTEYFETAVASVPEGQPIYVPNGTFLLNNVIVDRDVSWILHPKAVLLHMPDPDGNMMHYTVPCTGSIRGGTFDGNKANQSPYPQPRYALLSIYSDSCIIDDVVFRNYMLSCINDGLTLTKLTVQNCDFLNGAEHGGTYDAGNPQYSCCINIFRSSASTANTTPNYVITGCYMKQDANNVTPGAAPGGIIIAGSILLNCYIEAQITNNRFERLGQSFPLIGNAHHIGSVDLYSCCKNTIIQGNLFLNNRYQPVKLTNCSRTLVDNNIIIGAEAASTAGLGLIDWQAALRGEVGEDHETLIVTNNTFMDGGSTVFGLRVSCETGSTSKKIIVANNYSSGCGKAAVFINTSHAVQLNKNIFYAAGGGGSAGAVEFQNFTGNALIGGNYVEAESGVHAFYAVSGNTGTFDFDTNRFVAAVNGIYPIVISGSGAFRPAYVHCKNNKFLGTTNGTLIAASGVIDELWFDVNNIVTGSHSIDFTNVTNCIESVFGSANPNGLVNASRECTYRRTDPAFQTTYKKELEASGTNTGWRIPENNNSAFVLSADYAATINDTSLFVSTALGNRIITLPTASECPGKAMRVIKSDNSVGNVTISTVSGGDPVLTTQFDAVVVISTGAGWIPMNLI